MANQKRFQRLDESVRLVMLQFSASNPQFVPQVFRDSGRLEVAGQQFRDQRVSGVPVLAPTANTSLAEFPGELESAGYELVEAHAEQRTREKAGRRGHYYIVRFTFARQEAAQPSDFFLRIRERMWAALVDLCLNSFWQIETFSNPYFQEGREITGVRGLSINLKMRIPLRDAKGELLRQRAKDEQGQPYGEPVALQPKHRLRVLRREVHLEPHKVATAVPGRQVPVTV